MPRPKKFSRYTLTDNDSSLRVTIPVARGWQGWMEVIVLVALPILFAVQGVRMGRVNLPLTANVSNWAGWLVLLVILGIAAYFLVRRLLWRFTGQQTINITAQGIEVVDTAWLYRHTRTYQAEGIRDMRTGKAEFRTYRRPIYYPVILFNYYPAEGQNHLITMAEDLPEADAAQLVEKICRRFPQYALGAKG